MKNSKDTVMINSYLEEGAYEKLEELGLTDAIDKIMKTIYMAPLLDICNKSKYKSDEECDLCRDAYAEDDEWDFGNDISDLDDYIGDFNDDEWEFAGDISDLDDYIGDFNDDEWKFAGDISDFNDDNWDLDIVVTSGLVEAMEKIDMPKVIFNGIGYCYNGELYKIEEVGYSGSLLSIEEVSLYGMDEVLMDLLVKQVWKED